MSALADRVRRHRHAVAIAFDVLAWVVGFVGSAWIRLEGSVDAIRWLPLVLLMAVTTCGYLVLGEVTKLHRGRARTASLDEMLLLGSCVALAGLPVFIVNLWFHWIPRSVPLGGMLVALVIAAWARAWWRRLGEKDVERLDGGSSTRVLVVGAGEAGRELISSMLRDPQRTWRPVGLLDDDPTKRHLRIRQVPVVGTTEQMAEAAQSLDARTVVLALPSADAETINRLRVAAVEANLGVKVLPASTQLLHEHVGIRDLRDINLTDVLGRNQLDTDLEAIAGYLTGRRVLVTGAGGSIGSELCRQIHRFQPAELMMLDRDESALHAVQLSIYGRALLDSSDVLLCDIRDRPHLFDLFRRRRPDVVFHAAALKHLPMLEQFPAEAVKTNVDGTVNVLDAAEAAGVARFVNISTDKAANPTSVLGFSKRLAERVTAERAGRRTGSYMSVRFGNVLGSRGSVLESFARQIAVGGPVTITHPDVTRYFMTIEEACQLVIQAAAIGRPREVLVLDMGKPVRIVDVARQLIEQSGTPVPLEFTGLRPGEKLHEELFGDDEPDHHKPAHALISHVEVPPVDLAEITALPREGDPDQVRAALARACLPPLASDVVR